MSSLLIDPLLNPYYWASKQEEVTAPEESLGFRKGTPWQNAEKGKALTFMSASLKQ